MEQQQQTEKRQSRARQDKVKAVAEAVAEMDKIVSRNKGIPRIDVAQDPSVAANLEGNSWRGERTSDGRMVPTTTPRTSFSSSALVDPERQRWNESDSIRGDQQEMATPKDSEETLRFDIQEQISALSILGERGRAQMWDADGAARCLIFILNQ